MPIRRSVWMGAFAGAIGGALGTVLLNLVQTASLEVTRKAENCFAGAHKYTKQQEQLLDMFEQAHVATAESLGLDVQRANRKQLAMGVEFAFGIVCGAVYGALAEQLPAVTTGSGTIYGAVLFTGASEVVLPAIGFVPSPVKRTPVQHLGGLTGNVVYGVATEALRSFIRARV